MTKQKASQRKVFLQEPAGKMFRSIGSVRNAVRARKTSNWSKSESRDAYANTPYHVAGRGLEAIR